MSIVPSSYDPIAAWYAERCDAPGPVDDMMYTALVAICPPLAGASVCDFACGAGHSSRLIARHGAVVTGIDASPELIRIAQERETESPLNITYRVGDLTDPETLNGDTFDGIVCSEGLMAIPDLPAVLDVAQRSLRKSGWLAFSITHPCFVNPSARSVEGARCISQYFTERPWRSPDDTNPVQHRIYDYHRTLATYINALRKSGFAIEEAAEPRLQDLRAEGSWLGTVPGYLTLRCTVT